MMEERLDLDLEDFLVGGGVLLEGVFRFLVVGGSVVGGVEELEESESSESESMVVLCCWFCWFCCCVGFM